MKFIQFFFVMTLCTAISCTDSKVESNTSSNANETMTSVVENQASTLSEKIEKPEENTTGEKVVKAEVLIEEKTEEEIKETPKVEEKSEAYKKASEERRKKRRQARKEKREREKAAKLAALNNKEDIDNNDSEVAKEEDLGVKVEASGSGKPQVLFKETEYNFGVIKQGDKITHDFVFENTGDGELEILNVNVTCGCTTPTFPFLPIAPGEKGTIGVTYNSTGKLGNQKPMITIITNAKPHTYKIYLKGVVDADRVKPEKEEVDASIEKN